MEHKTFNYKSRGGILENGVFEGYASTWDIDEGEDQIVKGAFSKTISERGGDIILLFGHDNREIIGKTIEMREDDQGLFIKAKISDTARGREAKTLINDEVIKSMSIGYSVPLGKSEMAGDIRIIKEIKLYEISVVPFPMNPKAVITKKERDDLRAILTRADRLIANL